MRPALGKCAYILPQQMKSQKSVLSETDYQRTVNVQANALGWGAAFCARETGIYPARRTGKVWVHWTARSARLGISETCSGRRAGPETSDTEPTLCEPTMQDGTDRAPTETAGAGEQAAILPAGRSLLGTKKTAGGPAVFPDIAV